MPPSPWIRGDVFHLHLGREAARAYALLEAVGKKEGNTGGAFCVLRTDRTQGLDFTPQLLAVIDRVDDPVAVVSYRMFAQEKAWRLLSRPSDASSYQSRDEAHEKWGGAIRAGDYILSFSGLPELVDEALMLVLAVRLELIGRAEAERIAALSHNAYFAPLAD